MQTTPKYEPDKSKNKNIHTSQKNITSLPSQYSTYLPTYISNYLSTCTIVCLSVHKKKKKKKIMYIICISIHIYLYIPTRKHKTLNPKTDKIGTTQSSNKRRQETQLKDCLIYLFQKQKNRTTHTQKYTNRAKKA